MDIQTFLKSLKTKDRRHEFSSRCGTTLGHLQNVSYGLRPCSPQLAVAIEQQSDSRVTRKELLPDTWHLIWPELIDAKDLHRDGDAAWAAAVGVDK